MRLSVLMLCILSVAAKVITGYRIRDGIWTMLGKGDPQAPQVIHVIFFNSIFSCLFTSLFVCSVPFCWPSVVAHLAASFLIFSGLLSNGKNIWDKERRHLGEIIEQIQVLKFWTPNPFTPRSKHQVNYLFLTFMYVDETSVWPFKWKLMSSAVVWYRLFFCILQNKIWDFFFQFWALTLLGVKRLNPAVMMNSQFLFTIL